jgi:DNA primase
MPEILNLIQQQKQDAVLWRANALFNEAGDDPFRQGGVKTALAALVASIPSADVRATYVSMLPEAFKKKLTKADFKKSVDSALLKRSSETDEGSDPWQGLPAFMDKEQLEDSGFCAAKGDEKIQGYWGWGKDGKVRLTNFTIKPIFHVYDREDSRHIFEIQNHRKTVLLDVQSKVFISTDAFSGVLVGHGNFLIWGSNNQLRNISSKLLDHFPMCIELKQLGWQHEGFFAYVNKIFVPGKGDVPISEWGIATMDDINYLVPAASKVYQNVRTGDDPFENDRVLQWMPSPVTFKQWAQKMGKVYDDNGLVGVACVLVALFRDIVFAIDHNCPHAYGYGEKSAGKSKWAESMTAIFYKERSPFQLNSGTDFAFFSYMQRFRNGMAHLNEFDDKVTKDEWFQSIKGVFDGEGRERGKMNTAGTAGSKNRTETQRVDSMLVLTGQFLITKDDNSVVSRSIICPFFERAFTDAERKDYDELKSWEAQGLTSLAVEVLQHRPEVKEKYYTTFNEILSAWRRKTTEQFNQRIFQNWCHLSAMWKLFQPLLGLPIEWAEFDKYSYEQALYYSKFIRDSDILSEFWNTVSYMLDQQQIFEGWDFHIQVVSEIKLRGGDGKEHIRIFGENKKLLLIRLNNVHKLYQIAFRQRSGKEGLTFENLKHYFSNRNYFIGQVKQSVFKRWVYKNVEKPGGPLDSAPTVSSERVAETLNTTAYVFDYDLLNCELERGNPAVDGS